MSLALEGTTASYVEKGLWWKGCSFAGEMSRERRAQLVVEAETAFRARCSAFLVATVEMVRRQCEMCLTEAVEDALQRYSTLLHDAFQLSNGSPDGKNLASTDDDYVAIKMEDNASAVQVADERYESQADVGDVSGSIQWTAPLADYELDDEYDSVVNPSNILDIEMNAAKKEEFIVEEEMFLDTGHPNIDAAASTQPPLLAHTCEQCGRSFGRKSHLNRHRLIHTGERPYTCHICHRRFSQKVHLNSHLLLTHNGTDKAHSTPMSAGERAHSSLIDNGERANSLPIDAGERPYTCHICQRRFTQKAHLASHLLSHNETEDKHNPPPLPPVFPTSQQSVWPSSTMMRLSNLPERPVEPCMPLPSISTQSKLSSTTTPRRHRCHECGKYFTRSSHLNRHRLVHTGERPHVCSICRKAFSQKVHLQAHLRRQHQDASDSGVNAGGGVISNVFHEAGAGLMDGSQDYMKRSP